MRLILVDSLHVFVILMMTMFVFMNALAATGAFDSWTDRYSTKAKKLEPSPVKIRTNA